MKSSLITYIFVVFAGVLFAQSGQELIYQPIPESPEVSQAFEYNPAQSDLFRGSVNFSVPLFNVQSDNLSLNSSLNYQSNGMKVNSISSQVGAEWELNMGGSVSRVVKDQPDDANRYVTELRQCMDIRWCLNCDYCQDDQVTEDCEICEEEGAFGSYKKISIDEESIGYLYNAELVNSLAEKDLGNISSEENIFLNGNYFNLVTQVAYDEIEDDDIIVDVDAVNEDCLDGFLWLYGEFHESHVDDVASTAIASMIYNNQLTLFKLIFTISTMIFEEIIADPDLELLPFVLFSFIEEQVEAGYLSPDCLTFEVLRPVYDVYDSEPDQFSFNFNGFSGRFVFDKDGEAKVLSHQDIKIEYTLDPDHVIEPQVSHGFDYKSNFVGAITEFKITTPDGVKYFFDAREISFSNAELQGTSYNEAFPIHECDPPLKNPYRVDMYEENAAYTNWKLTRIEVPSNDEHERFEEIKFEYQENFFINHSNYSQTQQYSCSPNDPDQGGGWSSDFSESRSSTVEYVFGQQLTNVYWKMGGTYDSGGKIALDYGPNRQDLYYPSEVVDNLKDLVKVGRIKKIKYFPSVGLKSKVLTLKHSYYDQLDIGCSNSAHPYLSAHRHKLRLDQIDTKGWDIDGDTETLPPYRFTYNDTPIPPRHSAKQDHWGYYNGEKDGVSDALADKTYVYLSNHEDASAIGHTRSVYSILNRNNSEPIKEEVVDHRQGVGNRALNADYAKAGILERVDFPTGAWNAFEYEQNAVGNAVFDPGTKVGGLRVSKITNSDGLVKRYDYTYSGNGNDDNSSGYISDLPMFASAKRKGDCYSVQDCEGNSWTGSADEAIINTIIHSSPINETIDGFDVGYKKVTERLGLAAEGKEEYYGRTIYDFSFDPQLYYGFTMGTYMPATNDYPCTHEPFYETPNILNVFCRTYDDFYPFPPMSNVGWKKGLLERKIVVDAEGDVIMIEDPGYTLQCTERIFGIKSRNNREVAQYYDEMIDRSLAQYYFISGDIRKTSQVTQHVFGEDKVVESQKYYYEANNTEPSVIEHYDGGSLVRTEMRKYANTPGEEVNLLDKNYMIGIPLETLIDNGKGGGTRLSYSDFNSRISLQKQETFGNPNLEGNWKEVFSAIAYYHNGKLGAANYRTDKKEKAYKWDDRGLLDQVFYGDRVWDYEYNKMAQLESVTDHNGVHSMFEYDPLSRTKLKKTNNGRIENEYTYDFSSGDGFVVKHDLRSKPDGLGYLTETEYDALGREVKMTKFGFLEGNGNLVTSMTYNELGKVLSETNPEVGNGATEYAYLNSPLCRLDNHTPAGSARIIDTEHLAVDNQFVTKITDEDGRTTSTYKDVLGRTTKTIDGLGNETSYTYNERDQVLTITPPLGDDYVFTYYSDGMLKTKTVPHKGTYYYFYNFNDQLIAEILPNGVEVNYHYHNVYNDFLESVSIDGETIKKFTPEDPALIQDYVKSEEFAIYTDGGMIGEKYTVEYSDFDYDFGRAQQVDKYSLEGNTKSTLTFDDFGNLLTSQATITGPDGIDRAVNNTSSYIKGIRLKASMDFVEGIPIGSQELKYNGNNWLVKRALNENIQTIDYGYNDRGWLTSINSVADTYLSNDPCDEDPIEPTDPDCDKIIDIVQYYFIEYNCLEMSSGTPTSLRISRQTEYFDEGQIAQAASSNEFIIPLNGAGEGLETSYDQSFDFTLSGPMPDVDFTEALLEILIDCINDNPQLLDEILAAIEDAGTTIGGDNPGGPQDGETSTNNTDDVFGLELHYEDGNSELSGFNQHNGNISWMEWRVKSDQRHAYGFGYDGNNRLRYAIYGEDNVLNKECEIESSAKYTVPNIDYDAMGNIKLLHRNGLKSYDGDDVPEYGPIDGLSYDYDAGSSILNWVKDASSTTKGFQGAEAIYEYDDTGNLTSDSEKGITKIVYSYHDLPLTIETDEGVLHNWYTTEGLKIKSKLIPKNGPAVERDYIDGAEYVDQKLEVVYVMEGRVAFPEGEDAYPEYLLKDHLGNVRARIADKNRDNLVYIDPNNPDKDELMNYMHYYPYGMQWDTPIKDINGNSLESDGITDGYTYNGKEDQNELGMGFLDYGARYYDPAIGRWSTIDPLAEKLPSWSAYSYVYNNPVRHIDPDGKFPFPIGFSYLTYTLHEDYGHTLVYHHELSTINGDYMTRTITEETVVLSNSGEVLETSRYSETSFGEIQGETVVANPLDGMEVSTPRVPEMKLVDMQEEIGIELNTLNEELQEITNHIIKTTEYNQRYDYIKSDVAQESFVISVTAGLGMLMTKAPSYVKAAGVVVVAGANLHNATKDNRGRTIRSLTKVVTQ